MTTNSNIKLGICAFANFGGLGVQTRRLCSMLSPSRVMVIDSSSFSKNKEQDFTFFEKYEHFIIKGFPKNHDCLKFIDGLTHVLFCENPYNFYVLKICRERGIKTFVQVNYEFCENLGNPHLPIPDMFLMPSYWKLEEMEKQFGKDRVMYLPPPIHEWEFDSVAWQNIQHTKGKRKFLHIVGTLAHKDRNGTEDVLEALSYATSDFELVITSQHPLPDYLHTDDPRVTMEVGNKIKNVDLYKGIDLLILPRRYGGLCLTANEAMMSAVPVLMPDILPNNRLLPKHWLIPAKKIGEARIQAVIDVYKSDPVYLAGLMDSWEIDKFEKKAALAIAVNEFSDVALQQEYQKLWI